MASTPEMDDRSGVETTGHEWDGIKELNNPLPRWWVWVFWVTVIWSVGYWIAMPAWPLIGDYTKGVLGYSQRAVLDNQLEQARKGKAVYADKIGQSALDDIRKDPQLLEFALAGGRSAFAVNCSQCHGSGAAGTWGYPNLNDDEWLWGGKLGDIHTTIRVGVRSAHDDTRVSEMPAFLRDEILTDAQIGHVVEYVLSLSRRSRDAAAAAKGAPLFAEHCAACHKETGKGNREFGAPDLTDAIWLFGGEREKLIETVSFSRRGVMPAWEGRLDPVTLKLLTVYVHSLGGGEQSR